MEFQKLLLDVGKSLSSDEVEALAFLCTDLLLKNPNSVDCATDFFSLLINEERLSADNHQLLVELLLTIQCQNILRNHRISTQQFESSRLISPYRKMLYNLSEQITEEELKQIKFLLKDIPRRKLEQKSTLGVFLEMERMDLINEDNLDYLERILNSVYPALNEKIRQFRQEITRPRSSSLPSESNQQNEFSYTRKGSFGNTAGLASTDKAKSIENNSQENIEGLENYSMTGEKRGICLIVNNRDFSKSIQILRERQGTDVDKKSLEKVFDWLGFDVRIEPDCDGRKIQSLFREVSKEDHSKYDCLVCCVLSHGVEGIVFGVDGDRVSIKDLMEPFDGRRCPSLVEKPKLFFIQACQGSKEQEVIQTDGVEDEANNVTSDAKIACATIPCAADFLVGMATVPDYVSFRHRTEGTWYIQSLCQNLINFVPKEVDLVSILTKVNNDVSKKTDSYGMKKQMPQPRFSLRKRVIFPVPKSPPPPISP